MNKINVTIHGCATKSTKVSIDINPLADSDDIYFDRKEEAINIYHALYAHLPSGTFDELVNIIKERQ